MRECTACKFCFPDHRETCERDGAPTKPTLPIDPLVKQRYRLVKRLGRGSISVVYHAIDEQSGTEHALKLILPEYVGNSAAIGNSFLSQAETAFALRHPNIVTVTDCGMIDESFPFIVMDFVAGLSLDHMLSRSGPLSPSAAFEYLQAIGEGLSYAHSAGIVHGDLKPRNMLIDNRGAGNFVKLTDFGVAAIKAGKLDGPAQETSGVLRSPLYLAPEEWSEEQSDTRSDIYSLGAILYHMLTGAPPFSGKSNAAIMKSHMKELPPAFADRFPGVTVEIEKIVLQALEKDPARRPESVEDLVNDFGAALTDEPLDYEGDQVEDEILMASRWSTTIQPILLALGVVLVITLIGVGVYYSRMSQ